MLESVFYVLLYLSPVIFNTDICGAELSPMHAPPALALHPPGELDYTDVVVKREFDNLTLVCELRGDAAPRVIVWNYVGANTSTEHRPFTVEPVGPTLRSTLTKWNLQPSDSGHYMCSAPPFSVTKYILVQTRGPQQCARGAFWCGEYCVLAAYVCDGFRDCPRGEDEAPVLCAERPCASADKLNCSSGRCIPEAACCRASGSPGGGGGGGGGALCRQPACCDEHPRYSRLEGYVDLEYPPLFEDRHAPDDYGFIQSTIYTVTACALIFMIAVVLLVSAICKMHMKRAALRSYAHAERATTHHYNMQYAQAHRFPPCYEASRLLEAGAVPSPLQSVHNSPVRQPLQCSTECPPEEGGGECAGEGAGSEEARAGFGLARLSAIFSSRYRQVPTQCLDVEMTDVRSTSLNSSPTRNQTRTRLDDYRSPTYCDLNTDFFFNPETSNCGRDLNYMATPVEFFRRRTLRGNFDRVIEHMNRPRPLTLQLGRFQLSIPRLGRRTSLERRPDTPNVAELNIDDIDFVRLNSNDTYTLNGRTIRLLGANFENYPGLNDTGVRPPPYTEAVRYKLYGPPPEYLSRDGLNNERDSVNNATAVSAVAVNEEQARSNVEMPPCYEDLASGVDANANVDNNEVNDAVSVDVSAELSTENSNINNVTNNELTNVTTLTNNGLDVVTENISSVIDNLPAIDSDVNANETETLFNEVNNANNELLTNNNVC